MSIRILHTADLHLSKKKPHTLNALDEILKVAKRKKIDLLTISGDLFDKPTDAEELRVELRKKFSKNDFKVVAIPGNHDSDVYRAGLDFGENFIPLTDEPFCNYSLGNVNLVAVPYIDKLDQDILEQLKRAVKTKKINILLLHCTLDIGFSSGDFGDETTYCPISKSKLERLNYDYILAGHFHTKTNIIKLNENSTFIYPGSPTSITSKETGKRKVVFIDLEKKELIEIELKTFYYNKLFVTVIAGKEEEAIINIRNWLKNQTIYDNSLEVTVDGFISQDEIEFRKQINEINEDVDFNNHCTNISHILNDPLFIKFKEKLNESEYENKNEIDEIVLEVFSKVLAYRR